MNGVYFPSSAYPEEEIINKDKQTEIRNNYNFDNILKNNIKKKVTIYLENKSLEGILEDYKDNLLIISNPTTDKWIVIKNENINYLEFEEKIDI